MADQLDPQLLRELNDNLRYMNEGVASAASGTKTFADGMTEAAKAEKEAADVIKAANKRMEQAQNQAIASMAQFGQALTSGSEGGFNKFGSSLNTAAGAVATVAKSFGPLGAVLGGLVQVGTKLLTMQLKQADDALKASDEIKKLGNAGALSTKEVMNMVHGAGLSAAEAGKLTNAMKKAGSGIVGLGDKFGDGANAFGKMVAVTDQQREGFQRLGISQEELMGYQGDYLALQKASGMQMNKQAKDGEALKKASLDYTRNLVELSNISGNDIETAKKNMEAERSRYEVMIDTARINREINAAEQSGNTAKADMLKKELASRNALLDASSQYLDEDSKAGLAQFLATGAITDASKQFANAGVDMDSFRRRIKAGEDVSADFSEAIKKATNKQLESVGTAAMYDKSVGKNFLINEKLIAHSQSRLGIDEKKMKQDAKAAVQDQETGKKEDTAESARNAATTAAIKSTVAFDTALSETNPIISGFNGSLGLATLALAGLAAAGTAALAAKAAGGAGGGLIEGLKGVFGKGASALPGAASTVASTVPMGKNGKALAGAALQSHLKKQAGTAALGNIAGAAGTGSSAGGSKVMSMVGDAGPALAKLGTGVGEGAAGFLKAFANPMVLVGATTLGASIAAMIATIGAGIAGASWIMGKALPTLMEGIKSFEQIDGAKLKDTGEGMVGLGKGLAVFGAGGAAAGIGGIISNMSEGITSFFGGKTPIDKMVAFSKLDINAPKVKENAEAFTAFSEAFAMGGVGQASAGLGNTISNITDGIGKLFGQKDIIEKFVDFSKLNIDAKKTKEMAEAFAAFSSGVKGNASAAGGGAAPAIKSTSAIPSASTRSMSASPAGARSAAEARAIGAANPSAPLAMAGGGRGGAGGASSAPDGGSADKTASPGSAAAPAAAKSSGSTASLSDKEVKDMIMRHEGVRNKPYKDSLGLWTVGVGHLIGDGHSLPDAWNRTFTDQEVQDLYDKDFDEHQKAAATIPGYDKFNSAGKGALTDLTFNMGPNWIKRFPTTAKSIEKGDGAASAAGLQDSKWYTQVGSRAQEVVGLMSKGGISARDGGITDGPESGYPATLHGNEIITPLSANSILEQLGKTPASEMAASSSSTSTSETIKEIYSMNSDVMDMLAEKMDTMIAKLSDSNDTQSKLLMYSRV